MIRLIVAFLALSVIITSCGEEKKSKLNTSTKSKKSETLFRLVPKVESGIEFNNKFSHEKEIEFYVFQYQFNGGGVGIGDFDNDGLQDVYFCGNEVGNKLFKNKGDLKFEDVTKKSGTGLDDSWSNGVAVVDINNDGFLDIYVSKGGNRDAEGKKNALLINNGDMTFTERAEEYGIADTGWSTNSIFFDYDNDQDLDLFVLNHPNSWAGDRRLNKENFKNAPVGADHFYVNEGGKFKNISDKVGLKEEVFGGYGLGVSAGDLDQNGFIDLYISNDYDSPDYLYMNQGDGTFKEEIKQRTKHIALYSMGNDIADYNNDGLLDIIALDMSAEDHVRLKTQMGAMAPKKFYELVEFGLPHQYMYNTLQLNNGNGTFSEIGQLAGVQSTDWSWAPLFADFDNDGFKDLMITNGYRLDDRDNDFSRLIRTKYGDNAKLPPNMKSELFGQTPSTPLPNYIYKNNGDYTFSKKTYEWGISQKGFSQGASFADLDNDGDLDILINNIESDAWLYENRAENIANSYIDVILTEDHGVNSGAMIEVKAGDLVQVQQFQPTRGYMSSSEPKLHFGLGEFKGQVNVTVTWSDGSQNSLLADANSTTELNQNSGEKTIAKLPVTSKMFDQVDNNGGINFTHRENKFDDFEKEILLPHRNSQHGPALASGDLNGDGLDDIYVGGAHKQAGVVYFQKRGGQFEAQRSKAIALDQNSEDLGALIYDYDGDGDNDLYVASGGNEFPEGDDLYRDRLYVNDGKGNLTKSKGVLPDMKVSGKSISAGDMDGDGDLDLFVGGRLIPGTYPFPPRSYVLKYEDGKYTDVTETVAPELVKPGLVTNSIWQDFNGDGKLDLLVVGEWMPISLYYNDGTSLKLETSSNLQKNVGWWSGLAVDDMDGDGDLDILVGNLGLNYKYKATADEPFQIWCHDFDENGSLDIVLGYYDHGACYPVRGRQCSSQQMPFIKDKFPTYNEFAAATIKDVYGDKLNQALNYQATNFSSVYIENQGDGKFAVSSLPKEAQFSMVTSIVTDNDGDSKLAILTGNLYTAEVETPRADASIGIVLKFLNNSWTALNYTQTGLSVEGDSKNMVLTQTSSGDKILIISKNDTQPQVLKRVK